MKSPLMFALLLAALPFGTAFSRTPDTRRLDSLFAALAKNEKAMGSVALSKNGTVFYRTVIGYCDVSKSGRTPATHSSRYRIGSISKMFTASMVLQLVEEGALSLSTTIDAFFPDLPNAGSMPIGTLLNHRSGLHNFTNDPDYPTWMTQPKTRLEMLALISRHDAEFAPGEKASYSNANYVLLGYIIETVTKRSYADNVRDRITAKIGLAHTYVGGKIDVGNNECRSFYNPGAWTALPETDMSIPGGAGAVVSTPDDLVKFIEALFSLKIVSRQSLDRMKTITDGYGMGLFQIPFHARQAFGHGGAIDGFAANLAYFPEDSIAIAYCTNGQVYPLNDILIGVLSIVFDREYAIPTFTTLSLQAEALDAFLGVYSSAQLPLKITITKDRRGLIAQASGQSPFPLEAVARDTFTFDQAGIRMEFDPAKQGMTLKQGGGVYLFTKGQ